MDNTNIYEEFLSHTFNKNKEQFDLGFNESSNQEEFEEEFVKFLAFTDFFFAQDGILVTMINSYCYSLDIVMLKYVCELYKWADKCENRGYVGFISEYILTYHLSLRSELYKEKIKNYRQHIANLYSHFPKKSLFTNGQISNNTYHFYLSVIDYSSSIKKTILPEVMKRMLTKFRYHQIEYQSIFDRLLLQGRFYVFLSKNDYNLGSHREHYLSYVNENLSENDFSDELIEIIMCLYRDAPFNEVFTKTIINHLIMSSNSLCAELKARNGHIIRNIAQLEILLEQLNKINSLDFGTNNNKFKAIIRDCKLNLLHYKRQLLSDEEYTTKSFQKIPFSITVSKPKKSYREYFEENLLNLYFLVKIDFDQVLEASIRSYNDHPIIYNVTNLSIDSTNGLYSMSDQYESTVFSEYFERKGKKLTSELRDKLRNTVNEGFYKTMVKYESLSYSATLSIIANILKDDSIWLKNEYRTLLGLTDPVYENDYLLICKNVISIEYYLYKIAQKKGFDPRKGAINTLSELFREFESNDEYRNGFLFVNFILYDENGLNLRNKLLHGTELSSTSLVTQIVLVFACVIYLNYFISSESLQ